MLVSMTLRCAQCGHENDARYRFCGMCGAKLPPSPELTTAPKPAETPPPEVAPPPPAKIVSGPSFLGLADEPSNGATYLLEDETDATPWGRYLLLLILLGGAAAVAWIWRANLRNLASSFSGTPANVQTQPASSPAPIASPSEVGGSVPTSSTPPVMNPAPVDQSVHSGQPATAAPSGAPGANPPAATTQPPAQNPASPSTSTPAPAQAQATQAAPAPQNSDANQTAAQQSPPAKPAGVKAPKAADQPSDDESDADALESQGERYLYGTGGTANCDLAQKSLQAAAEHSSKKAQSVLGTMYATGHCVPRDLPLAYHWFARALHQDPGNTRISDDLRVLWNQMTPEERQLAIKGD